MKIRLVVPTVKPLSTQRPHTCVHCGHWHLHRHGTVSKPLKDHQLEQVAVQRYKCVQCGRTFRHYPDGVNVKDQSQRTVVLAALMYGLGLSCSATAHLLGALGVQVSSMTVWRDAQEAGAALRRRRPTGRVRVLGADETIYKVKGHEVSVGFVTDGQHGHTLGFEVLWSGDGAAFAAWLAPYVTAYGVEVLISDDNASYGVAATELGLEHQLCLAHVRKAATQRSASILVQAQQAWGPCAGRLAQLEADLERIRELLQELPATGGQALEALHRRYLWAAAPRPGEQATVGYRMRLFSLELWEHWPKLRVHLSRPALRLDGTNNGTERAIGKSKVRYKTMRGYKSLEGMGHGTALTQWLYSGADQHDLAAVMVA